MIHLFPRVSESELEPQTGFMLTLTLEKSNHRSHRNGKWYRSNRISEPQHGPSARVHLCMVNV
jgi:hypothetical protein